MHINESFVKSTIIYFINHKHIPSSPEYWVKQEEVTQPDTTEKLLTWMLNLDSNKQI